jgi:hypothetical protein
MRAGAGDDPGGTGLDHQHEPFPRWMRFVLYFVGWLLILLGVAALFLPGPGLLGLALGAAVLSVVSEALHARVRKLLLRVWPEGAEHLDHFRHKVENLASRFARR